MNFCSHPGSPRVESTIPHCLNRPIKIAPCRVYNTKVYANSEETQGDKYVELEILFLLRGDLFLITM